MKVARKVFAATLILAASDAFAAGGNMPWEGPLLRVMYSCTGPVAQVLGTIAIAATGIGLAFGEGGGLMRKALSVVFGLSIAFTASSLMADFFGYGGGVGF